MVIRQAIRDWVAHPPPVFDLAHKPVEGERVRLEYQAMRAHLLRNHASGESVALLLERDYRYLLWILACMEVGVAFVPLRIEWPAARIDQIRGIVGFRFAATAEATAEIVAEGTSGGEAALPPVSSDQPLYCLFTSGTTGMPKGVVIRRRSYENFLLWTREFFRDIGPQDRLLNSTDYTFDVSLAEVAITLMRRAAFYCSAFRDDLFTLLYELHELRITTIATVPNNFMMLLDERWLGRADLSALRHALIAGSRFPLELSRQFRRHLPHANVYNCYGPTEATIYCLARRLDSEESDFVENDIVSVGWPLPGCVARIVDEHLNVLGPGERGELVIGGVQVMDGYLNSPEATRRALVEIEGERYYRTGDLAFCGKGDQYFVAGRNDDTVKVAGQRVNLSDVDAYVQKLDFVKDCATIAVEDELRGASLILYVVATRAVTREEGFAALRDVLPRHQLPQDLRFVDALPVNNSGKISKRALRERYLAERAAG